MKRLISRLLQGIIVLLGVTFLVFIASYLTGDPARLILGETASQEMIESYREFHGLNDPIIVQYGRFVMGILRGDFGTSLYYSQDCLSLIADKLVNTIQLASISLVLSLLLAIPLGILSATRRNTWVDTSISFFSLFGQSAPNFWLALMLMLVFSVNNRWLPVLRHGLVEKLCAALRHADDVALGAKYENDALFNDRRVRIRLHHDGPRQGAAAGQRDPKA